ncbi:hypothetical protein EXN66_Car011581 [Channa argus]|uniref:Ricin B lectin domain-containing protein n=1 Tax=Channa argus TaxID=215402 RepID=A0A6G1Q058_CHAAH|nr:hypothetical protein EXN66_Car011581 [Channa argus]KAK2902226.1 hypothetical protein Q8A73_011972 [Channa argus]
MAGTIGMGRRLLCVRLLVILVLKEVSGLKIRNKLLGKCLQVGERALGSRVSLGECSLYSPLQDWHWLPESQALSSPHTGECLTAPGEQYEGVLLQPCIFSGESGNAGVEVEAMGMARQTSNQAWLCSKKGHLILKGRGLHLSATQDSTLVFLSREHNQGSRWRTLDNQTLCDGRSRKLNQLQDEPQLHLGKSLEPQDISNIHKQHKPFERMAGVEVTETYPAIDETLSSPSTKSPADPTMIFFTMDYGMGWKITMLLLSSLALVLGTVILILNVYSNRKNKVVCVLKSYTPRAEMNVPGSPVPSERALLTKYAMRLPHSSPSLQRGEILIEWKDGTFTPLYEA